MRLACFHHAIYLRCLLGVLLLGLCAPPAPAQSTDWTPMLQQKGVDFDFILYRFGDGENDGVVVRLINHNEHPVVFRFKMVFKGEDRVHVTPPVEGHLDPGEMRTGESGGLWWIPFKDGTAVQEVGMRGFKIIPLPSASDTAAWPH